MSAAAPLAQGMAPDGPPPPAPGGDEADAHLQRAIRELTAYAHADVDPADQQAATAIIGALQQFAAKDTSSGPRAPADYSGGSKTAASVVFGNAPR